MSWEHPQWLRLLTIPAGGIVKSLSLDDLILLITCTRGSLSANNSHTLRFYGADLTVDYTGGGSSGPVLSTKVNGSWVNVSKVYKKVSGIWVEQSDIANLFSTDTNYVKG